MLRIFVPSSHLSAIFMALYAKKTFQSGCVDLLIVESPRIKEALLALIHGTRIIHPWSAIHDFVYVVQNTKDMKPSMRKTITRKLKTRPFVKQLYNLLYGFYIKKERRKTKAWLETILKEYVNSSQIELNLLPQNRINPSLMELFPRAQIRYFEHGLGDYLHADELKREFHTVFPEAYAGFLKKRKKDSSFIFPGVSSLDFASESQNVFSNALVLSAATSWIKQNPKGILILMESAEMYNVKKTFWTEYLDACIARIPDAEKYMYIVKPHPTQSAESIEITRKFFQDKGYSFTLLDDPALTGMCVEFLFSHFKDHVSYVFALFSSSLFYLSALYPSPKITYYYSYDFMKKHIGNAPEQYKAHFQGLEELIREVFSGNCKSFS